MIFSVDYEDWYHLLGFNESYNTDWDSYESFLPTITPSFLDLLDENNVKGIFFVLGYVAKRFPELIIEISQRGHLIGSHGYNHDFIFDLSQEQFEIDLIKSKEILNVITGKDPIWYRAPGFSVTERSPWFYETLAKTGFKYDSSYSQIERRYGSNIFGRSNTAGGQIDSFPLNRSHVVTTSFGEIKVVPVACNNRKSIMFGGGYFRIVPFSLIRRAIKKGTDSAFFYIHPRDLYMHESENIELSLVHKLRSNFGRLNGKKKLLKILNHYHFINPNEL